MIFKIKGQSHIKCTLITICLKILVIEHWFCHVKPHDQPWGQNVRITFQVNCKGHRINELKQFYYKLLVVLSSFNIAPT